MSPAGNMVRLLRDNQDAIMAWAKSLTHAQMRSDDFGGWQNGVLVSPLVVREDLFPAHIRPIFVNENVRQVVYIDIHPFSGVPVHNHRSMSYYQLDSDGRMLTYAAEGKAYRTTHFTIEAPRDEKNAYMFIQGRKHHWAVGRFEEFNVVDNEHFAVNNTPDHVKIIYVDFYGD